MKIYLDDERPCPKGWLLAKWPQEVIRILQEEDVECLSLDHDLGNDAQDTGYDVLLWIEEAVMTRHYVPPQIIIHTSNPSARSKMEAARQQILKFYQKKATLRKVCKRRTK